jgi:carboxyl-terminal processing protease
MQLSIITLLALFLNLFAFSAAQAKLPNITPKEATAKLNEIMKAHATQKQLTPTLIKRSLLNYLDELDPTKTYFIESDIKEWIEPSDELVNKILTDYRTSRFDTFAKINDAMVQAIHRRHELDKKVDLKALPKKVNAEEFKNMKWTTSDEELLTRITRVKALQVETTSKLNEELKEKSLQRIAKRQMLTEDEFLKPDPAYREQLMLTDFLKAFAISLDAHTAYFTPDEAAQFMINVQQRLFGIGAQLRDDVNGFSVVKIVEGSPAARGKQLKVKDRIIAVNGEPVVGMDITDVVEMIRGEENTPVTLTVIREEDEEKQKEETLDITIPRGEVVLKETRFETNVEPFGDGAIAYLRLYSFYQDPDSSSSDDITKALEKLKTEQHVKGVILDLRYNTGGLLSQAVGIAGLFITKGIVASIKDENGAIQHLRDLDGITIWDGPLIVLVNRASASASEIVAQSLQDYGRALLVGDDHTYGKGTFQTFTLNTTKENYVNPQGEYKVTRGLYYTVSGKTPQLTGVESSIVVPGLLSEMEIGEKFAKFPLENESIKSNFEDDLSDVPFFQREKVRMLYKFNLQQPLHLYETYLPSLKKNSETRIKNNKSYQDFLAELKKKEPTEEENVDQLGKLDFQLIETYNIMKDLLYLQELKQKQLSADPKGN